ncbi:MAG: transcription initiation protein [Nocardioidaceae bacterium]|nr:transcription initiation protein [Nocardioidaceae bacterium]
MRYLVLMSDDGVWDRAGETEQQAIMAAHIAFSAAVGERATLVGGEALAAPAEVVTLRAAATGSDRVVTDGPYAETVEQLGGFYLIEADSRDTVVDLCRILPASYTLQIWPVVDVDLEGM